MMSLRTSDSNYFQRVNLHLTLKCPRGKGVGVPNISFLRFLRNATDFGDEFFCDRLTCNSAFFGEKI